FSAPVLTPDRLRLEAAEIPAYARCAAGTLAYAAFTSGTTRDPRLSFHTHGDPKIYNQAIGAAVGVTPADGTFSVSGPDFTYGLGAWVFVPLLRGGTTVLRTERPTPDEALAIIERYGVTLMYAQPSFYARILDHPDRRLLDTLRLAIVSGEVLPATLERRL